MTPIPSLPLDVNLDTIPILKKLSKAHRALAELKGVTGTIPNQEIVISTLSLQEAKQPQEYEIEDCNITPANENFQMASSWLRRGYRVWFNRRRHRPLHRCLGGFLGGFFGGILGWLLGRHQGRLRRWIWWCDGVARFRGLQK